jgi:hypothetical protein
MTHWGWYWKVKQKHRPKLLCEQFSLTEINSFDMFKNRELVDLVRSSDDRISFEMPRYNLRAVLMPDDSLSVTYDGGSYIIPVEKKPCNYGGFYYFFRCPQCNERMRKLYCAEGRFLCRKCLKLGYYSQRLRPSRRALVQSVNVKKRLSNKGGSLTEKPVRMWDRTFRGVKEQYLRYDERHFYETNKELRLWYGARIEPYIDDFYCAPFSV